MTDLEDGETYEMQGSGKQPYLLKNTGGVYSCTCPAWRNQSIAIEQRTCKHLRKLRGDAAETERVGTALPAQKVEKDPKDGPPLLLAHAWENDLDLTGWWMSEKLDGVRAWWDGKQFLSRQGNVFHAPDWFVAGFPDTPLDGELWLDRHAFNRTISIVRRQDKSDHWKEIVYVVFDVPGLEEPFEERMNHVTDHFARNPLPHARSHEHLLCQGLDHLQRELQRVQELGGEGLMLRQPGSRYEAGRSASLLKVKTFFDAEAKVIDYNAGKGKHKGKVGSLIVEMPGGETFSIGTGLSDAERANPPVIGSVVTYRYQELTPAGVPRFPSFVGVSDKAEGTDPPAPAKKSGKKTIVAPTAMVPVETAAPEPPAEPATGETRMFLYEDEKSCKFWEITIADCDVKVRYGKQGADGAVSLKSFPTAAAARKHAAKLIEEKTGKGYVEE